MGGYALRYFIIGSKLIGKIASSGEDGIPERSEVSFGSILWDPSSLMEVGVHYHRLNSAWEVFVFALSAV